MKIALAQIFCGWGTVGDNLRRMEEYCGRAKKAGAALVAFPELSVQGMVKDPIIFKMSESLDGPSVQKLSEIAKKMGLCIGAGFSEKASPKPFNAYVMIDNTGKVLGAYRKNFIPKLEMAFWQGHRERPVFEIAGKKFGVGICWDNCQPELHEYYSKKGVEAVLMPHAWDADPLDKEGKVPPYDSMEEMIALRQNGGIAGWRSHDEMKAQFFAYVPAASKKFGFYSLYVNQTGQAHPCIKNVGPSFAVDKTGDVIAETRDASEQLVYCDVG